MKVINWNKIWKDFEGKFAIDDSLHDRDWQGRKGQQSIMRSVLADNSITFTHGQWAYVSREYLKRFNDLPFFGRSWDVSKNIISTVINKLRKC